MAHSETAEMFEIVGEVPGKPVVAANAAALIDGGNEGDQHKQDEGFIRKAIIVRKRDDSRLASHSLRSGQALGGWLRLALLAMTVKESNRNLGFYMGVGLIV